MTNVMEITWTILVFRVRFDQSFSFFCPHENVRFRTENEI